MSTKNETLPKIIASTKRGEAVIVLVKEEGQRAYVANTRLKERYSEQFLQSILARGYWLECKHDPLLLDDIEKYTYVKTMPERKATR